MTRTTVQQLGYFILLATNQPDRFTGRLRVEFQYYNGILQEGSVIGLERKIDLHKLNESDNKTLDKSESISYIPST